jgi:hypothetical protein
LTTSPIPDRISHGSYASPSIPAGVLARPLGGNNWRVPKFRNTSAMSP